MTPIWRTVMRAFLDPREMRRRGGMVLSAETVAKARCFDMREVEDVCYATSLELFRSAEETVKKPGELRLAIDVGIRTCVPAPETWLEFSSLGALLVERQPPDGVGPSGYVCYLTPKPRHGESFDTRHFFLAGFSLVDGYLRLVTEGDDATPINARTMMLVIAALSAINSPAAVAGPVDCHAGMEREMRRGGIRIAGAIQHTKITLRFRHYGEGDATGQHHPKAYHFCRAHSRQRATGKVELVRAHWRGDPAFGVRLPTYSVKSPALIEGDKP